MNIVVVGPTHPYKGGIAQHTTELALRLEQLGHQVTLQTWRSQYPSRLYPGQLTVDDAHRDVAAFERTVRTLTWYNPLTWVMAGRRAKHADAVVVAHSNPFQIAAYVTLLRSARRWNGRPARLIVAHNVMPHESTAGAAWLMARLRRAIDGALVHSTEEADAAATHLHGVHVGQHSLPPFGPALVEREHNATSSTDSSPDTAQPVRLLALGFVRPYKGLELLLDAMQGAPHIALSIRGECWDAELQAALEQRASSPSLAGRVSFVPGYIDAHEIATLFATHDLAALPYLEATGSQNVLLAFTYGVPVLVSDLSTLATAVRNDVDGAVVPAGDVDAWTQRLSTLDHATVAKWRANVPRPDAGAQWQSYCAALLALISAPNDTAKQS